MTYEDVLQSIHTLGNFGKPMVLDRVVSLLHALGDPQNDLRVFHIAGTNGKGSTSTMLAKVFEEAGYRTGLTISPFVVDFRERIQINGEFISKEDLVAFFEQVQSTGIWVTEFELITALAFLYFREKRCDVVVAETGLGGRLDATNVLARPEAALITKIGFDHADLLGNTITQITAEKCGIIKPGCRVITACGQRPEALAVIRKAAPDVIEPDLSALKIKSCTLTENEFLYRGREYRLSLCGKHQIENALTVIDTVQNSDFDIPYETVKKALANTVFPARAEIVCKAPLCVLDGAHNPDGAEALAAVMQPYHGRITALIGMMRDKDYPAVLKTTLPHCRSAVAVTVESMKERSLTARDLQAAASPYCPCAAADDLTSAIESAVKMANGDPVFVFGSLYLASSIRDRLYEFYKKF